MPPKRASKRPHASAVVAEEPVPVEDAAPPPVDVEDAAHAAHADAAAVSHDSRPIWTLVVDAADQPVGTVVQVFVNAADNVDGFKRRVQAAYNLTAAPAYMTVFAAVRDDGFGAVDHPSQMPTARKAAALDGWDDIPPFAVVAMPAAATDTEGPPRKVRGLWPANVWTAACCPHGELLCPIGERGCGGRVRLLIKSRELRCTCGKSDRSVASYHRGGGHPGPPHCRNCGMRNGCHGCVAGNQ